MTVKSFVKGIIEDVLHAPLKIGEKIMKNNIDGVGEVQVPRTFKEKMSNFWYHYKLHTLVAAFLVVVLTVCSIQFCSKQKYDAYILYAGGKQVGKTASDGDVAEVVKIISALKVISEDYDGDGEKNLNFTNYYFLSDAEASELGNDANYNLLTSDEKSLTDAMLHSEYYLCFMSVAAYEEYKGYKGAEMFMPLDGFKSEYPDAEYYSECAILLSSTDAYSIPGLSFLPPDTLICVKRPNALSSKSSKHKEYMSNAIDMVENILAYEVK